MSKRPVVVRQSGVVGLTLAAATLVVLTQLVAIWPAVLAATTFARDSPPRALGTPMLFGLRSMAFEPGVVVIVLVMLAGALGALVGVMLMLTREEPADPVGWSYLVRPLQGAGLAVVVYFALRGGFLGNADNTAPIQPEGVAAMSALVGLFTRQAMNKLNEVSEGLFGKPHERVAPARVDEEQIARTE